MAAQFGFYAGIMLLGNVAFHCVPVNRISFLNQSLRANAIFTDYLHAVANQFCCCISLVDYCTARYISIFKERSSS